MNRNSTPKYYSSRFSNRGRPKKSSIPSLSLTQNACVKKRRLYTGLLYTNPLLSLLYEKGHIEKRDYKAARFYAKLHAFSKAQWGSPGLASLSMKKLEGMYGSLKTNLKLGQQPYLSDDEYSEKMNGYVKLYEVITEKLNKLSPMHRSLMQNIILYDYIPPELGGVIISQLTSKGQKTLRMIQAGLRTITHSI